MSTRFNMVVLVERDETAGLVLSRALAARGWEVIQLATGRTLTPALEEEADAVVLVLDDDENDIFDTLVRLSSQPMRPAVVMLTRRAHSRILAPSVLRALGVDRVLEWPCRADEVIAALELPTGSERRVS
jgi:DNA-binding response OmpR family regulator